jgi:hypothetical protein
LGERIEAESETDFVAARATSDNKARHRWIFLIDWEQIGERTWPFALGQQAPCGIET